MNIGIWSITKSSDHPNAQKAARKFFEITGFDAADFIAFQRNLDSEAKPTEK